MWPLSSRCGAPDGRPRPRWPSPSRRSAAGGSSLVRPRAHDARASVNEAQKEPLRRSALGVCPCEDACGTTLQLKTKHSWAPVRTPRGQTLRSPRPKVTSVLTRLRSAEAAPARTSGTRRSRRVSRQRASSSGSRTIRPVADPHCVSRDGRGCPSIGDSKNTVRGFCLDIPRFEESLNS